MFSISRDFFTVPSRSVFVYQVVPVVSPWPCPALSVSVWLRGPGRKKTQLASSCISSALSLLFELALLHRSSRVKSSKWRFSHPLRVEGDLLRKSNTVTDLSKPPTHQLHVHIQVEQYKIDSNNK